MAELDIALLQMLEHFACGAAQQLQFETLEQLTELDHMRA